LSRSNAWLRQQTPATLALLEQHPAIDERYRARVREVRAELGTRQRAKKSVKALRVWWDGNVLTIAPEPPSANVVLSWLKRERSAWKYRKYRDQLTALLMGGPTYRGLVRVTTWWRLIQQRDEDSFGTSLKPVLDALQRAGIIENDRLVQLERPIQEAGGKGARTDRRLTLTFEQVAA